MINEYIDKATIAINEGLKNVKKGKLVREEYLEAVEEYFDSIYKYIEDNREELDASTLARIRSLESSMDEFIVPFYTKEKAPNEVENSDEYLLETIVYFTRKQLRVKESVEFETDSLRKQDKLASELVKDMCERLGLPNTSINISRLFDIPKNHNINFVKVDKRFYLIDCTYQQYFLIGQNYQTRFLPSSEGILTRELGSRILDRNSSGAVKLLEKGFISTEDPMFKDYFDVILEQAGKEPMEEMEYLDLVKKKIKKVVE